MRIVGRDQLDAGFVRELVDQRDEPLILLQAVVLDFEEEIVLAEDVGIGVRHAAGFVVAVGEDGLVDVAGAGRRTWR